MNNPLSYYSWSSKRKEHWDKCISFIRDNTLFIVLLLVYVLFFHFWEDIIGSQIVEKFLSHFESCLLNDIIFIIAAVICVGLVIVYWGRSNKRQTYLISSVVIIIWAYYRWISTRFDLTPLSILPCIKYFDIILVYAVCELLPLLGNLKKRKSLIFYKDVYVRDAPIKDMSNDLFEMSFIADTLIEKILYTETNDGTFTLGITAPWGAGKSSFMNMMKNHIPHCAPDSIVFEFNPWLYSLQKDLVSVFFDELSKSLNKYDRTLAENIIDYSKLLSAFNTSEIKIISSLIGQVQHVRTINEKRQLIIDSIKRINRRIIVFIDDLDRLSTVELMEMLKLIRNISDFPYMYIVAAYDKSYLVQCLEDIMPTKGADYLKKIFQHEEKLPTPNFEHICGELTDLLYSDYVPEDEEAKYEKWMLESNLPLLKRFPILLLSNPREIKRIVNYLPPKFMISSWDEMMVELWKSCLKIKYPQVYELFAKSVNRFVFEKGEKLTFYEGKDDDEHIDFFNYLTNHSKELNINESDISTLKLCLNALINLDNFKFDNL